ncbi:hypothetical protein FA95DRAFT_1625998, partial [Auriscalpium vulgare]
GWLLAPSISIDVPGASPRVHLISALKDVDTGEKLTAHNALPEDWAVRGMAWPGRGLYERGFWASGESRQNEMEMLDERDETEADGQIGDDSDETKEKESRETLRWRRVAWAGRRFTMIVDGFRWNEERRWWTEGALAEKSGCGPRSSAHPAPDRRGGC